MPVCLLQLSTSCFKINPHVLNLVLCNVRVKTGRRWAAIARRPIYGKMVGICNILVTPETLVVDLSQAGAIFTVGGNLIEAVQVLTNVNPSWIIKIVLVEILQRSIETNHARIQTRINWPRLARGGLVLKTALLQPLGYSHCQC